MGSIYLRQVFFLIVGLFVIFCFIYNFKTEEKDKASFKTSLNRSALQSHLETLVHRSNMYITTKNYQHNLHPSYYLDKNIKGDNYQMATYYVAAEIARRYHARYIVDVGCGNGAKVAKLKNQFHIVAIDYGDNFRNASKNFPFMTFTEANLDLNGDCSCDVGAEILTKAVVLSADVIEHIVDPLHCYIKLLKVGFRDQKLILRITKTDH